MGQNQVERKTFQSEGNVTEIIKTILEGYDIRLRPDFGGKNLESSSSLVLVQYSVNLIPSGVQIKNCENKFIIIFSASR